jgi:predicted acyltransferase
VLTPAGSINAYLDQLVLPGKLYGGTYDPEGILCIISATAITLMGAIAGLMLRGKTFSPPKKAAALGGIGLVLLSVGLLVNTWYPMIKNIWTSTFNLAAGGVCFMFLALFYLVIDVWKIRKWSFYFQVIGLNAITVYMLVKLFNIRYSIDFLLAGWTKSLGNFGPLVKSIGFLAVVWLGLYIMYRQKIFLRA